MTHFANTAPILLLFSLLGTGAAAEGCMKGGVEYSNGVYEINGGIRQRCDDGEWVHLVGENKQGSVCLFDGRHYSAGAVIVAEGETITCQVAGHWE